MSGGLTVHEDRTPATVAHDNAGSRNARALAKGFDCLSITLVRLTSETNKTSGRAIDAAVKLKLDQCRRYR